MHAGPLVTAITTSAGASARRGDHGACGESRVSCAQHFRSDVTAGEALGLLIAERLLANQRFQDAYSAARAELNAHGPASR